MKLIEEILQAWGADPVSGTDKQREHSYGEVYDRLFWREERAAVSKVLEIGLAYGASLKAWREAFPNALIIGLDNNPGAMLHGTDRIETFVVDATDHRQIEAVEAVQAGEFDLIIDDGSHLFNDQLLTAAHLLPKLKIGGFYVIEDVQAAYDIMAFRVFKQFDRVFDLRSEASGPRGPDSDNRLVVFHRGVT